MSVSSHSRTWGQGLRAEREDLNKQEQGVHGARPAAAPFLSWACMQQRMYATHSVAHPLSAPCSHLEADRVPPAKHEQPGGEGLVLGGLPVVGKRAIHQDVVCLLHHPARDDALVYCQISVSCSTTGPYTRALCACIHHPARAVRNAVMYCWFISALPDELLRPYKRVFGQCVVCRQMMALKWWCLRSTAFPRIQSRPPMTAHNTGEQSRPTKP